MVQMAAATGTINDLCASDRAQLFECSENLLSVTSQEGLTDCLGNLQAWLDVREIMVAAGSISTLERTRVMGAGYDLEWMDLYFRERFALVDPIVCGILKGRRFLNRANAAAGARTASLNPGGPTLERFLEAARDHGRLGCGFASGVVLNGSIALCSVVTGPGKGGERAPLILCALRPLLFQALMRVLLPGPVLPHLSPRERAILECLASGYDDPQIADAQSISVSTVRFHLGNVFEKLGARNRCHAVALGFQSGLLQR
jgi:DNA-binding CsgD family transcriptional regulator